MDYGPGVPGMEGKPMREIHYTLTDLGFELEAATESHRFYGAAGDTYGERIELVVDESEPSETVFMITRSWPEEERQPIHVTWHRYDEAMIRLLERWTR